MLSIKTRCAEAVRDNAITRSDDSTTLHLNVLLSSRVETYALQRMTVTKISNRLIMHAAARPA
jgi:hypothetical protein